MDFDTQLYRQYWHLVCHRTELPAHGDFVRYDTPLGELVVFNDMGNLVAFDNLCPHRGARIYTGAKGNQAATCQYHGWSYFRGRVVVPGVATFTHCDPSTARWNTFQTDWCGDFLFAAIAPRQRLEQQLGGAAEVLENISFNIDGCLDVNAYPFQCYWPVAIENALESYHVEMVHADTLGTLALEPGSDMFWGKNSACYFPIGNQRIDKQLRSLKKHFAIDYGYEGYMSLYLYPFTMLSSTHGYSYSLQHFLPAADGAPVTHFSSRLLAARVAGERSARLLAPLFGSTAQVNRKVFEEDHDVCRRVPKTSWSMEPLAYASDDEARIVHFRQACRERFD